LSLGLLDYEPAGSSGGNVFQDDLEAVVTGRTGFFSTLIE